MSDIATCITETEEKPSVLNIGILGYNNKLSEYGFRQIIENNREQISKIENSGRIASFKDGTIIQAIINPDWCSLTGSRFDQLILFDDKRWHIHTYRAKDIHNIIKHAMILSNVPVEFQILKYEDIR